MFKEMGREKAIEFAIQLREALEVSQETLPVVERLYGRHPDGSFKNDSDQRQELSAIWLYTADDGTRWVDEIGIVRSRVTGTMVILGCSERVYSWQDRPRCKLTLSSQKEPVFEGSWKTQSEDGLSIHQ